MNHSVLVIKLGALGDILLALDAFQTIWHHHTQDRLVLLTRPDFLPLARRMPWFDEVWPDPTPRVWQVKRWLALRRRFLEGGFVRVYDLQCNDRTALYFRIWDKPKPEWVGAAVGCSHPRPNFRGQRLHVSERLLRQLEAAGIRRTGPADLAWLDGPLDAFGLPPRFVVLVPGCSAHRPEKRWPADRYAQLARQIQGLGMTVVAVGTDADREAIETLCEQAPAVINLAGRTDFGQLAALGRRAAAVIGNDTGPIHIFAAVGAPTLVLYSGKSDPVVMRPNGPHVAWLQRDRLADLPVAEVWRELSQRWPQLGIGDRDSPRPA